MAAKQIQCQCPNCGAGLQASQLIEVKCPYCSSKFENPLNQAKTDIVIKKIIPFSVTEDDIRQRLFDEFVNTDEIPQDIFDQLQFHSLKQYFLPMYHFSGRYDAAWSCTVEYNHTDKQGKETREYRPTNGVATGNFSMLSLANSGNAIPKGVAEYASVFDCPSNMKTKIVDFTPSLLINSKSGNIQVVNHDISESEAWNKNVLGQTIGKQAKDAADNQTSSWIKRDYHVSVNFGYNHQDLILVPIWYGAYSYKGEEFYFAIDGQGTNFNCTYPKNKTYKTGFLKRFMLMVASLLLLTYVFGLTTHWTHHTAPVMWSVSIGGILLGVRYIIEYVKSKKDIKQYKQYGKAKMCGEAFPMLTSNYEGFKRMNRLLTWMVMLIVIIIGIISTIGYDIN